MEQTKTEKNDALGFVTKKVLVTFYPHVALMIDGNCVAATSAVCEYQQPGGRDRDSIPHQLTVVGLPNGPKLTKSIQLSVAFGHLIAVAEITE